MIKFISIDKSLEQLSVATLQEYINNHMDRFAQPGEKINNQTSETGGTDKDAIIFFKQQQTIWAKGQFYKCTDALPVFDGTYNASSNKAATVSTVTSAIQKLDGIITGTSGTGQTITSLSQTDGKVSATFGDISITKSQVSDFPTLGEAAAKDFDTTVTPNSDKLITSGAVSTAITNATAGLTGAMHFIGTSSTPITDDGTQKPTIGGNQVQSNSSGDVVLFGNQEFVWNGSAWELLGDEGSYALKSTTVTGTGVLGGGGAISSNQTITHNTSGVHSNDSAQAYGPTGDVTGSEGATIKVPQITVDKYGHITSVAEKTYTSKDTTYTLAGLMGSTVKGGTTQPIYWNGTAFANTTYTLGKSVPSNAVFTDQSVTAVGNHYTPTADSNAQLTANISGTAGSYALNTEYTVLTGVKAQRDAKGHITGLTYTAQKIKDTNTTYAGSGGITVNNGTISLDWAEEN